MLQEAHVMMKFHHKKVTLILCSFLILEQNLVGLKHDYQKTVVDITYNNIHGNGWNILNET